MCIGNRQKKTTDTQKHKKKSKAGQKCSVFETHGENYKAPYSLADVGCMMIFCNIINGISLGKINEKELHYDSVYLETPRHS